MIIEEEDGEEGNEDEEAKEEEVLEIEGIEKKLLVVNESSRVAIFGRERRRMKKFARGFIAYLLLAPRTGSSGYRN